MKSNRSPDLNLIAIGEAVREDLGGILELYQQLNPDDPALGLAAAQTIWQAIQQNPGLRYFVAKTSTQVVGTCNISIIPNLTRMGRPFGLIENVIVHADFRRQKLGEKLIQNAILAARAKNCYKVILLSSQSRREAHAFYEAIGFNGNSKQGYELRME